MSSAARRKASLCPDKSQAAKKWQLAVAIVPPKLAAPTRPLHRHGRDMASPSAATAYSARAAGGSLASLAPRRAARPPLHARAPGHAHARLGSRVLGHGVRMAIADTKLRQGMVCDVGTWRTGDQASTADVTCCTTDIFACVLPEHLRAADSRSVPRRCAGQPPMRRKSGYWRADGGGVLGRVT